MFGNRTRQQLSVISAKLDRLELCLIIRDPGTARSADAYEGLRKTLIQANKSTDIYLANITELDRLAAASDETGVMRARLVELLTQVGITRIDSPGKAMQLVETAGAQLSDLFDLANGGGGRLVVDRAAYVDQSRVISRGLAHFEQAPSADTNDDSVPAATAGPTGETAQTSPEDAATDRGEETP